MSKFVIRTVRTDTGEFVYNKTSNLTKQLKHIKQTIIDLNAGLVNNDRFNCFMGVDLNNVEFEVYPYTNTITGQTVAKDPKYSLYC